MDARIDTLEETLHKITQLLAQVGLGNLEKPPIANTDDQKDRTANPTNLRPTLNGKLAWIGILSTKTPHLRGTS